MFYRSKAKDKEELASCEGSDVESAFVERVEIPTRPEILVPKKSSCLQRLCILPCLCLLAFVGNCALRPCLFVYSCLKKLWTPLQKPAYLKRQYNNDKRKRIGCCRAMLYLACFLLFSLLGMVVYGMIFSAIVSQDPCEVARRTKEMVRENSMRPVRSYNGSKFIPYVPRIIHQQWKDDDIPEKYQSWHQKWLELYPNGEFSHMLWTDESARRLIEEHYPWFLSVYDGYKYNIQRADASRYFILYHYGGCYADLDYEPVSADFWDLIPKDRVGLVESPYQYNEFVQNSLMSSPVNDPFFLEVFSVLVEKRHESILQSTGPVLLDVVLERTQTEWSILPCENFHRLPLGELKSSPLVTLLHREVLGRFYPMKYCGDFSSMQCHYAKHHNTAVYVKDTGVLPLLFPPQSKSTDENPSV